MPMDASLVIPGTHVHRVEIVLRVVALVLLPHALENTRHARKTDVSAITTAVTVIEIGPGAQMTVFVTAT